MTDRHKERDAERRARRETAEEDERRREERDERDRELREAWRRHHPSEDEERAFHKGITSQTVARGPDCGESELMPTTIWRD